MEKVPAELMKEYVNSQKFTGTTEIMDAMKTLLGDVLNDLKNRGVQRVYVFCVDGFTGFREAIGSVYPKAQIQRCIIHQIRSSTKFVSYKDVKKLMSDLKSVYQAINEEEALNNLMKFKENW